MVRITFVDFWGRETGEEQSGHERAMNYVNSAHIKHYTTRLAFCTVTVFNNHLWFGLFHFHNLKKVSEITCESTLLFIPYSPTIASVLHSLGWSILPRKNQYQKNQVPVLVIAQSQQLCKPCFHLPIYSGLQGPGKTKKLDGVNENSIYLSISLISRTVSQWNLLFNSKTRKLQTLCLHLNEETSILKLQITFLL